MKQNYTGTLAILASALLLLSSCGSTVKNMPMDQANSMYYEASAASESYGNDSVAYDDWDAKMESGSTAMAKAAPMQTNANLSLIHI